MGVLSKDVDSIFRKRVASAIKCIGFFFNKLSQQLSHMQNNVKTEFAYMKAILR